MSKRGFTALNRKRELKLAFLTHFGFFHLRGLAVFAIMVICHRATGQHGQVYRQFERFFSGIQGSHIPILPVATRQHDVTSGVTVDELHFIPHRRNLFHEVYSPVITFSGDTQIEFVLENEDVRNSKVLFLECTYVDEARPVERARKWGHTHLFEIAANAEAFKNVENLVLIHFSPRYSRDKILDALRRHLPEDLHAKTTAFL